MEKKDFGRLVAALRQDLNLTQFDLAERAGLDVAIVSQVERGVRQHLEPPLLRSLATALELKIHERRPFFSAASGLEEFDLWGTGAEAEERKIEKSLETLDKLIAVMDYLRAPAYVEDAFGEIVAANSSTLEFYRITPELMEEAARIPLGYNVIRLMFGNIISSVVTNDYDKYLLNSVRAFREMSLPVRAHPYFRYLMAKFRDPKKYPGFERYWRHAALLEDDKDINVDAFEYVHALYGPLHYITIATIPNTPHGELRLIYNIPMDQRTAEIFEQIASAVGTKAHKFAPWPVKQMV
ncbi:MAG: helix-turn-helix transcriptional regulator [Chloroflexota bacterium]